MAESDSGEKTEEPTAKKLSDARKKGQIARSKDLGTMFVLVGSAVAMMLMGNMLVERLALTMKRLFTLTYKETRDLNALFAVVADSVLNIVMPLAWIFVIIMIAAFVGNTMLGGISFSWEAMAPKASRLSPLAGFKRMFGVKAWVELLKSLMKFFVVFIVAYLLLTSLFDQILALSIEAIPFNFSHAVDLLLWMFLALALSLVLIVVVDAPYQVWDHNKQLKMTKQEISDKIQSSKGSWLFVDNRLVDVDILPEIDLSTDSKVRIMPGIVGGMNNEKIRVEVADSTGHSVIDMSRNDLVKMSQTNGSWVFVNDQLVSAHEIAKMDFDNETKVRAMPGLIGGL